MPLVVAQSTEARTVLPASIVDSSDDMQSILTRVRSGERMEHYETVRLRKDGKTNRCFALADLRSGGCAAAGFSETSSGWLG